MDRSTPTMIEHTSYKILITKNDQTARRQILLEQLHIRLSGSYVSSWEFLPHSSSHDNFNEQLRKIGISNLKKLANVLRQFPPARDESIYRRIIQPGFSPYRCMYSHIYKGRNGGVPIRIGTIRRRWIKKTSNTVLVGWWPNQYLDRVYTAWSQFDYHLIKKGNDSEEFEARRFVSICKELHSVHSFHKTAGDDLEN